MRKQLGLAAAAATLTLGMLGLTVNGAEPTSEDTNCYGIGWAPGQQWGPSPEDIYAIDAEPCRSPEPYQESPAPDLRQPVSTVGRTAPAGAPITPGVTPPPTDTD